MPKTNQNLQGHFITGVNYNNENELEYSRNTIQRYFQEYKKSLINREQEDIFISNSDNNNLENLKNRLRKTINDCRKYHDTFEFDLHRIEEDIQYKKFIEEIKKILNLSENLIQITSKKDFQEFMKHAINLLISPDNDDFDDIIKDLIKKHPELRVIAILALFADDFNHDDELPKRDNIDLIDYLLCLASDSGNLTIKEKKIAAYSAAFCLNELDFIKHIGLNPFYNQVNIKYILQGAIDGGNKILIKEIIEKFAEPNISTKIFKDLIAWITSVKQINNNHNYIINKIFNAALISKNFDACLMLLYTFDKHKLAYPNLLKIDPNKGIKFIAYANNTKNIILYSNVKQPINEEVNISEKYLNFLYKNNKLPNDIINMIGDFANKPNFEEAKYFSLNSIEKILQQAPCDLKLISLSDSQDMAPEKSLFNNNRNRKRNFSEINNDDNEIKQDNSSTKSKKIKPN